MTDLIYKLEKMKSQIQNLVRDGIKLAGSTSITSMGSLYGKYSRNGREYVFSEEFSIDYESVVDNTTRILGETVSDQKFVENTIWDIICDSRPEDNVFDLFQRKILQEIGKPRFCVLPNYQVRFEDGLEELQIGPVRAVLGRKLADELNRRHSHNRMVFSVDIDANSSFSIALSGVSDSPPIVHSPLDAVCWEVEVRSTTDTAKSEAIWLTNIAISLIRILLPQNVASGMFPHYGEEEPTVSFHPHTRSRVYLYREEEVWLGSRGVPSHYKVSKTDAIFLSNPTSKDLIESVFNSQKGSVGASIQRGLGWLSRARQSSNQAERYLYNFTAIETLLSRPDGYISTTDIIAQNLSVLLQNDPIRASRIVKRLKAMYSRRSRLIHSGNREFSAREAALLHLYAEAVYRKVILEAKLTISFKDFHANLRKKVVF